MPVYKIWQILKRFAGTFRPAQTLKLGGVTTTASKRNRHVSEAYCRTVLHTKTYNDAGMYWAFYIVLETSHKSKIQKQNQFSYYVHLQN